MENIPTYNARKHGEEEIASIHPKIDHLVAETQGVIVYQEQVMEIAKVLSGYSLGEADLLRRAMGKKIKAEMDAQRTRFVDGAVARDIPRAKADEIFDLLAKFADYGFNKSHAAAYALVSYQTAYLKAHYPVEFLAASMTLDMSNTDKLVEFRREAHRLAIKVEAPAINYSFDTFEVADGAIRYALSALKGVGTEAVRAIVAARGERPFADISDFARRISGRLVNKRVVETLASAGAFDALEPRRTALVTGADVIVATANAAQAAREGGQSLLFGVQDEAPIRLPSVPEWPQSERLRREFEAIGFFLSGHPLDEYADGLAKLRIQTHAEFGRAVRQGASAGRLAATVIDKVERRTKTGNRMGILQFSDQSGQYEAILFSEGLAQFRDLLTPGAPVLLAVAASYENEDLRLRVQSVEPLETALARVQQGVRIFVRDALPVEGIAQRLTRRGEGEVALVVMADKGETEVEIRLPGRFDLSGVVVGAIKAVPGVVSVQHV
jgi:DNA polymerase-3 subunit alpha